MSVEFRSHSPYDLSPREYPWVVAREVGANESPNPLLIVARFLADRRVGVSIRGGGGKEPTLVEIQASDSARKILEKIIDTPEFRAVSLATSAHLGVPDVDECQWPQATKTKVTSLYWQRRREIGKWDGSQTNEAMTAKEIQDLLLAVSSRILRRK